VTAADPAVAAGGAVARRRIPAIRRTLLAVVALVLGILPFFQGSVGQDLAIRIIYYVLLVASWNLLAGYAGLFSFGHVAFASVGAYATVLLMAHSGFPPAAAFVGGGAAALLAGVVLGALSSRIRGPYFVVASFGFLVVVKTLILGNAEWTGGASGIVVPDMLEATPDRRPVYYYLVGLLVLAAFLVSTVCILRSRVGRILAAFRDDDEAAAAIGLNPRRWKMGIFAYSSFWAGLAGSFFAFYSGFITPGMGSVAEMSTVVAMGVAGGLGSFVGPILSTTGLEIASDQLTKVAQAASTLLFGVALLVAVAVLSGRFVGYEQLRRLVTPLWTKIRSPHTRIDHGRTQWDSRD
jgi:branched-chain amino acid transport system permease protein